MKHARLPASAAHRWTKCPASAYIDEPREGRGSEYAAEGTAAHALAEYQLTDGCGDDIKDSLDWFISVNPDGDTYWNAPGDVAVFEELELELDWHFLVNQEMVDAVNIYLQATQDAKMLLPYPLEQQYVEKHVDPGHKDTGGTLDWACVAGPHAVIADFKYGRGVIVEVEDNPQQMIYALGLLNLHPQLKQIESIIVQPRAPHIEGPVRSITYSRTELNNFSEWLFGCIREAQKPQTVMFSGEHCRFCPALATCPEVFEEAKRAAAMEFKEAYSVPINLIVEALDLAPIVEAWVKAVRKEALSRLMDEQELPGWKLVHGRSSRNWTVEEEEVIKTGRKAKLLKGECFTTPKLLSPPAIEKAAAKKGMTGKEAYAHFVELYEVELGGPAIAPESDPRVPYKSDPEDDFEAV